MNGLAEDRAAAPRRGWEGIRSRFLSAAGSRAVAAGMLSLLLGLQWLAERQDLNPLRYLVFDAYQRLKPRAVETLPVAIITIDDQSLARYGQWPWPRSLLAELVERTAALEPLVIGLDMVMPEPDRLSPASLVAYYPALDAELRQRLESLPSTDELFAETIAGLPVVIGRAGVEQAARNTSAELPNQTQVLIKGPELQARLIRFAAQLTSLPVIDKAARGHGLLNVPLGAGGVVRRVPLVMALENEVVPALALEMLRVAVDDHMFVVQGGRHGVQAIHLNELAIPTDPDGALTLYFSASVPERRLSAAEVLAGRYPPGALANRMALIGVTGLGVADAQPTPVDTQMDGVEIQAQAIETILSGSRLLRPAYAGALEAGLLALAGGLLILVTPRLSPAQGLLAVGVLALVGVGASFAVFAVARLLLDPTFPVLGTGVIFLGMTVASLVEVDRKRRQLSLENARLAGELDAARELQKSMLPDLTAIEGLPGNLTLAAVLESAREVGGDLYDTFMLDRHRLCFLVGDVADKGIGAALFMAQSKGSFKHLARHTEGSVGALLSAANAEIVRDNTAQMFITAVAGLIDARTGMLEFCTAGHPDPLLVQPGRPPRRLTSSGGPPLGILDGFAYPTERVRMEPGELLLAVTDGVTEAQAEDGRMYGTTQVALAMETLAAGAEPPVVVQGLLRDIRQFMQGGEPADDITILAIQYRAPDGPAKS